MRKVIVFDLDDTLYKEIDFLKSAYKEIAWVLEQKYRLNGIYDYLLASYYRGDNVFDTVNKAFDIQVPLYDYLAMYRNHLPHITLSSTVRNVLERLLQMGVQLGILTDGRTVTQTNKIQSLGLSNYISNDNWIISESFGYAKPFQKGYLFFQDKYPDKTSFYYVGDNTAKDFKAPNELGWKSFCLLDNGDNIHKQNFAQSSEMLPTFIINDMSDLLKYI